AFHYVSSSPWQLYGPLQQLLSSEGFPPGAFHLKNLRFRDPSVLRLVVARRLPKRRTIFTILKTFPQRRFVLVGDSGEKDPEIYGDMARKFPSQVKRIFIRNVAERPLTFSRAEKAFRNLPARLCKVYRESEEIDHPLAECAAV
ncbi:MAG: App1 family protein, partial [Planctomycetales bacterium]|nr:App1 family protein [Planctomycetales bacterium]